MAAFCFRVEFPSDMLKNSHPVKKWRKFDEINDFGDHFIFFI